MWYYDFRKYLHAILNGIIIVVSMWCHGIPRSNLTYGSLDPRTPGQYQPDTAKKYLYNSCLNMLKYVVPRFRQTYFACMLRPQLCLKHSMKKLNMQQFLFDRYCNVIDIMARAFIKGHAFFTCLKFVLQINKISQYYTKKYNSLLRSNIETHFRLHVFGIFLNNNIRLHVCWATVDAR